MSALPDALSHLHFEEEKLRGEILQSAVMDDDALCHFQLIESVMDLADALRRHPDDSEDLKVVRLLGMRVFNAFASSIKLLLSGYGQNAALILRDVLEIGFLLDYFQCQPSLIAVWRTATRKVRREKFSPAAVRNALDLRDGFTERKREAHYRMLSEMAGHASMQADYLLRPQKDGLARIGPFASDMIFKAVTQEMGRIGLLAGEALYAHAPADWDGVVMVRYNFALRRRDWTTRFRLGQ